MIRRSFIVELNLGLSRNENRKVFIFSLLKGPFHFGTVFFLMISSYSFGQAVVDSVEVEGKMMFKQMELVMVNGSVFTGVVRQHGKREESYTDFTIRRGVIIESKQYESGRIIVKCPFVDGVIHGACDYYSENGKVQFKLVHERGRFMHEIFIENCKVDVL